MKNLIIFSIIVLASCAATNQMNTDQRVSSDFTDVSYENHVKHVVSNNCITCHSGSYPSANMALDNYDGLVSAVKNRGLISRINNPHDPMPSSGMMDKYQRGLFQKWIDNEFAMNSKTEPAHSENNSYPEFAPPNLLAVDIENEGFEFLEKMQGHWVGKMFLLGQNVPWFALDFRAIGSSQVHGLFEGGSMGNLFNTFFIGEYKGVKTIMLRNGGVLSGIYRTSYFVLTEVKDDGYLFEDAYGGKQIMWIKVSFKNDKIKMLTYTSKFGSTAPSRHMEFNGTRHNDDLSKKAAQAYGFPSMDVVKAFPNGMPLPTWGAEYPTVTSASYIMAMEETNDYVALGKLAKDPIQITDLENIASLKLNFPRTDLSKDKKISIYLSREPLTDTDGNMKMEYGYVSESAMRQVILFPEINNNQDNFTLTYLHTGKCYITFVIDNNGDMTPSKGDFYSISKEIYLNSEQVLTLEVNDIEKEM